jgi:hypothetical protein
MPPRRLTNKRAGLNVKLFEGSKTIGLKPAMSAFGT